MKKTYLIKPLFISSLMFLVFTGCVLKPKINPNYKELRPSYVLVLPPENLTSGTEIEETVYPIIYEKLSRRGYYCLSPEVARAIFNSNKLEDAGRINSINPQKFKELFGVDAILKVRVTEWESKYYVIGSSVNVGFEMELINTADGASLWSLKNLLSKAPSGNSNGILGALVQAAVHAAMTPYEPIAEENAMNMVKTVPKGPYAKK
ncbi:MAG: DUF799 family lipoprotein [Fibrobacteria bacterium]|nr:DUF799 family lipoprotein [Fibrobacteria bacterium]